MKRKKKEGTPKERSKLTVCERKKRHSEQHSDMTSQRTRTVSRPIENTSKTLEEKESDIKHNPKTRRNGSDFPERQNSLKKSPNIQEIPGIKFRSGRQIDNMFSPPSVADRSDINKNFESVRRSSRKKNQSSKNISLETSKINRELSNKSVSSDHSPGLTSRTRRRIDYSPIPKLISESPSSRKDSSSTVTANSCSPNKKYMRTLSEHSIKEKHFCEKILTPQKNSPSVELRSRSQMTSPDVSKSSDCSEPKVINMEMNLSNKICTPSKLRSSRKEQNVCEKKQTLGEKDSAGRVSMCSKPEYLVHHSARPNLGVDIKERGRGTDTHDSSTSLISLRTNTPSKSVDKLFPSEHPRSSPVTRSCSKNTGTPISLKKSSVPNPGQGVQKMKDSKVKYVQDEAKSATQNDSNYSLNINKNKQNNTKLKEKKMKRKLQEEEPFLRRKKLRSEVKDEELWEGFLPIRFKRLTPRKNFSKENGNRSSGMQENHSKPIKDERRSFADLYDEFLLKSERVSSDKKEIIKGNIYRSVSDENVLEKSSFPKSEPNFSNSASDIIKFCERKNQPDIQEIFSKLKREYESENKRENLHGKKTLGLTDINKRETNERKCNLSNSEKPTNSSVITPKRSARLQEKKSLNEKSRSSSSKTTHFGNKDLPSLKKKSARSLFSENANSIGDFLNDKVEKDSLCDRNLSLNKTDEFEPLRNSPRFSRISHQHKDSANKQNFHHSLSVDDKNHHRECNTTKQKSNKVSETNQVSVRIATRGTPNRGKSECVLEQKLVQNETKRTKETCKINEQSDISLVKITGKETVHELEIYKNRDSKSDSSPDLPEVVGLVKRNKGISAGMRQFQENSSRKTHQDVPSLTNNAEKQETKSDNSTEFSNNALTYDTGKGLSDAGQDDVGIIRTSSENIQQNISEDPMQNHNSQHEQHLSSYRQDMSSSSEKVADIDNEVIKNMLWTIVTQIEDSVKLSEVKNKTDFAKMEDLNFWSNQKNSEKLQCDDSKYLFPNDKISNNGANQQSEPENYSKSNKCTSEEGSSEYHVALKIVVRKTGQGAQIVKKPGQQSQGIINLNKNIVKSSYKQTRSRTRSGEGEMARRLDNPDTELRPPRHKGKQYPRQPKGSSTKDKHNAQAE